MKNAEYGSGPEKRITNSAGLGGTSNFISKLINGARGIKNKGKNAIKGLFSLFKRNKRNVSPSENESEKAGVDIAKSAEDIGEGVEAVEALEGRTVNLAGEITADQKDMTQYINLRRNDLSVEQREHGSLYNAGLSLNNISPNQTDAQQIAYLRSLIMRIINDLKLRYAKEGELDRFISKFIRSIKDNHNTMTTTISELQTETGVFTNAENREKRDFRTAFNDIKEQMRLKQSEINKAKSDNRKANKEIINQMQKELSIMRKNYATANNFNKRVNNTFKFMDNQIKQSKNYLNRTRQFNSKILSLTGKLDIMERNIKRGVDGIRKALIKFEGSMAVFQTNRDFNYAMASVSSNLNEFTVSVRKLKIAETSFDAYLRNDLQNEIALTRNIEFYQASVARLTAAEEAAGQGVEAMTQLIESITSNPQVRVAEEQVKMSMRQLRKPLEMTKRIQAVMMRRLRAIENYERAELNNINKIVNTGVLTLNFLNNISNTITKYLKMVSERKIASENARVSQGVQMGGRLGAQSQGNMNFAARVR
ncbi:MAG: hypothetical protein Q8O89_00500 [Nanoarchaeota archaeon]|nr:hypothetical protein [Nanoarchaeota archaeon]